MKTKFVTIVIVMDPDTFMPVEVEIRKIVDGGWMVGLDGSWLQAEQGRPYSPYGFDEKLQVPDAEADSHPHPRGWVFVDADSREEVGFAPAGDYATGTDAVRGFSREYVGHFEVFFRTPLGTIYQVHDDSIAGDFP